MRTKFFIFMIIVFFITKGLIAQSYSVSFTSPSNNSWVSGSVIDSYRSSINLSFTYSGTKADSRNLWKFHIIKDIITGVENSSYADIWVYEGTSSCSLPGEILDRNIYEIYMFEEDYSTHVLTQRASDLCLFVYVQQTVYVDNNFSTGYISVNSSNYTSGTSFNLSSSNNLSLAAIENQTDNDGYSRVWNISSYSPSYWSPGGSSISFTYYPSSSQNGIHITAYLRKICNISFSGPVYAGSTYYNSSPVQVVEGNPVSVTATSRVSSDYINQNFQSWADNSSTQNPRTFTVSSNQSVGINYTNINPNNGYRGLSLSSTVGDPIMLTWNEHPSNYVTEYMIYRKVRPAGGQIGNEQLIATVNRGTTYYTDYDYVYSNYFYYQVYYDVRAYYSLNSTTSDPDFVSTYANQTLIANNNNKLETAVKEIPKEYAVSNYPNPFNPTTTINYQLPADGMVTLKVYDILGKEVATLVNDNRQAGYYNVVFDASKLTSGIYIYTIRVNNYVQSRKMILMK